MTSTPSDRPDFVAPALNLLDMPWIPVRLRSGESIELGLLTLFQRASEIESLAETSPPNLVALHRLLLAITHRALSHGLGTWTDQDRARWYRTGLPTQAFVEYLEHWRERFWLFHPEYPFMQVAALAQADETRDRVKPWTQIALQSANGNTPVVFDHAVDTEPKAIHASLAFRQLVGFLQFTPGGLVRAFRSSDKAGPLANTAAVAPIGNTLSQTLVLGLHPMSTRNADDFPCWERSPVAISELQGEPAPAKGYCDRYTRLSRAVLLLPLNETDSGMIRWIRFGAGIGLEEDSNAPDPMSCFRAGSNGLIRMTFQEGRAVWRDLGALLPDETKAEAQPAPILSWAANLYDAMGECALEVPVLIAGLCSDQAKLIRWRSDRYNLPSTALQRADVAALVRQELKRAEELYYQVRGAATEMLANAMPDSHSKDTRTRARSLLDTGPFPTAYFSAAERRLPILLQQIGRGELDTSHAEWSKALLHAAEASWSAACAMLGQSATALRAEAMTRGKFLFVIRELRSACAPQDASNRRPDERPFSHNPQEVSA